MEYIKKDTDRNLIVLIIFFLILFISFTVYYESELRGISVKKWQNDKQIEEVTAQVMLEKLNSTERLNKLALIDKEFLEEKYSDLVVQHENLKKENSGLQEELTLMKSELEYQKVKIDGPVAQFRLIQDKNEQIKQLKEKISALCQSLKENNISDEGCK